MPERPDIRARRLKPSRSGNDNNCVTWLFVDGRVEIGSTERPAGPAMVVAEAQFLQLEQDVKHGHHRGPIQWRVEADGSAEVSLEGQPAQVYTAIEWKMWRESLAAGLPGIPVAA
jgi:hypothetical protein